jgi:hypothetical protein
MILVQHEVIVYGENEKAATSSLLRSEFMKNRTNLKCVFIQELPMPNEEKSIVFEDWRKAPGA